MKINKSKIIGKVMLGATFFATVIANANTHSRLPFKQDEGPEQPPGVAIDTYLIVLFISAIVIAGFLLVKKNNEKMAN